MIFVTISDLEDPSALKIRELKGLEGIVELSVTLRGVELSQSFGDSRMCFARFFCFFCLPLPFPPSSLERL